MRNLPKTRKEARIVDSKFYFTGKKCKHGHVYKRRTASGSCILCERESSKSDYRYHNEKRKWHWLNPTRSLFIAIRSRAKRKNIEFGLDFNTVEIPSHCPILHLSLTHNKGSGLNDTSPSYDRLDNQIGYTPENTRIVSRRANRLKSDGTAKEHLLIAKYVISQTNQTEDVLDIIKELHTLVT